MVQFLKEVGLFAWAVVRQTAAYMTGGIVAACVLAYEHYAGKNISIDVFTYGVAAFIVVACFRTWKEERDKRIKAEGGSPRSEVDQWRRLTDTDRKNLSLVLSDGNSYKIDIATTSTPDCLRLARDFYDFFNRMGWRASKPHTLLGVVLEPGIEIETLMDNVPGAKIPNIKERSGALLLIQAIEKIGLPVIYKAGGGVVDDLTIHLKIGMKP
jgi:hypothetical protein